ncbi:hypothetical protein HDE_02093 [Halotydeus destructor]|nr:hypothetical protein HDE_02093 [Halotydeus destructor]
MKFALLVLSLVSLNYSQCAKLNETTIYSLFTKGLTGLVYDQISSGAVDKYQNLSSSCSQSLTGLRNQFEAGLSSAYQFIDSSSKPSPGLLDGTVSSFGDYDQCLNIKTTIEGEKVIGQYCILSLALDKGILASSDVGQDLNKAIPPANYYHPLLSLCLPSTCSQEDVHQLVSMTTQGSAYQLLKVSHCDTRESLAFSFTKLTRAQTLSLIFVAIFLVLVTLGTAIDVCTFGKRSDLRSFSFKFNTEKLLRVKGGQSRINAADYIKLGFAMLAVAVHAMVAEVTPAGVYTIGRLNDIQLSTSLFWLQPYINPQALGVMAFLGGLVAGWTLYPEAKKANFSVVGVVYDRWQRFVPGIICLLAMEFLWPLVGSGPLYTEVANDLMDDCSKYWYRNLLFILNWHHVLDNCINHTFYSSIDLQLFALGAVAVHLLHRKRKLGIYFCGLMIALDMIIVAVVSWYYETDPTMAAYPVQVPRFIQYLDYIHNPTYSYMSYYFSGLLVGVALTDGYKPKLGKISLFIGLACIQVASYAPAVHNTFQILPQAYVPIYFVCIKILWAVGNCLSILYLCGLAEKTPGKVKTKTSSPVAPPADYYCPIKACCRLSGSLYLINYWYIRWDFFSHRNLFETTNISFLNRFIYTVPIAMAVTFVFHCIFIAPIENVMRERRASTKISVEIAENSRVKGS